MGINHKCARVGIRGSLLLLEQGAVLRGCVGKPKAEQFLQPPEHSLGFEVFQLVLQDTDVRVLGASIPAITIVTCKDNNRALFLEHFSFYLYPPTFSSKWPGRFFHLQI